MAVLEPDEATFATFNRKPDSARKRAWTPITRWREDGRVAQQHP